MQAVPVPDRLEVRLTPQSIPGPYDRLDMTLEQLKEKLMPVVHLDRDEWQEVIDWNEEVYVDDGEY